MLPLSTFSNPRQKSLQIGFEDVDTTEWFATLDSVDYVLATLDGSNVSARRK